MVGRRRELLRSSRFPRSARFYRENLADQTYVGRIGFLVGTYVGRVGFLGGIDLRRSRNSSSTLFSRVARKVWCRLSDSEDYKLPGRRDHVVGRGRRPHARLLRPLASAVPRAARQPADSLRDHRVWEVHRVDPSWVETGPRITIASNMFATHETGSGARIIRGDNGAAHRGTAAHHCRRKEHRCRHHGARDVARLVACHRPRHRAQE